MSSDFIPRGTRVRKTALVASACMSVVGMLGATGCLADSTYKKMCDSYAQANRDFLADGEDAYTAELVDAANLARQAAKEYGGDIGNDYADLADETKTYLNGGRLPHEFYGMVMLDSYGKACRVGDE